MNQKLGAKLGYSQIKIDHIADSLPKLQIEIGVHLINDELLQLPTLVISMYIPYLIVLGRQGSTKSFCNFAKVIE